MSVLDVRPVALPTPVAVDRIVSAGRRWLYALVLLDLIGAGGGAGQALYAAWGLGRYQQAQSCLRLSGLDLDGMQRLDRAALDGRAADFATCVGTYNHGQGIAMVAGALAVPVLAMLLMVLGAVVAGRRIRPSRRTAVDSDAVRAVGDRFGYWCDAVGLTGRRRPVLVLARPGRHATQAYTTALPWRRPSVVIPVGYAYLPQEQLDLVVLHELAHVRMRDLTWASATWWAGWLNVPVLVAALAPLALRPSAWHSPAGSALILALVLSASTLLLRAAVLRRRERLADRFAVVRGGCLPALRAAAGRRPGRPSPLRRLVAGHLRGEARIAAATGVDTGWEQGFPVAAAAGLLGMFTFQCLQVLLIDLVGSDRGDPRLETSLALAAAALAWAATVVPLWTRAGRPPAAGVAARVGGSVAGLVAGFYLQAPGTLVPVGRTVAGDHVWSALLCSVLPFAGVSVLAVRLAGAAGTARGTARRPVATIAATLGAAAVLATATDTLWALLRQHWLFGSLAADRWLFTGFGGYWWAAWTPGLVLLATAVVALTTARRPAARWAFGERRPPGRWALGEVGLVVGAAAGGGAVAIAFTRLRIGGAVDDVTILSLLRQRWWMCALTGWAVTFVALVRRRPMPGALLAGAAAAVLAGAAQYLRDVATGRSGHAVANLVGFVRMPLWLLFGLVVVTVPIAAPLRLRTRRRLGLPVTVLAAAVAALLVATGVTAPITGRPGDLAAFRRAAARSTPAELRPGRPRGTADPGRTLTSADAAAILERVRAELPAGWAAAPMPPSTQDTGVQPAACARRWAADSAADKARHPVADEAVTAVLPAKLQPPKGVTLRLGLVSLASGEAAQALFDEGAADLVACPAWSVDLAGADHGRLRLAATGAAAPASPYPISLIRITAAFAVQGHPMCMGIVQGSIHIGHTVVTVATEYPMPLHETLSGDQWATVEALDVAALTILVAALAGG